MTYVELYSHHEYSIIGTWMIVASDHVVSS